MYLRGHQVGRLVPLLLLHQAIAIEKSLISDINSLSELPLDKLLQVKSTIHQENQLGDGLVNRLVNEEAAKLEQQPFFSKLKKTYSLPSGSGGWMNKDGKKGITTLFQISVTALAFLAFGGYLLCLILQTLKNKNLTTITLTTLKNQRRKRVAEKVWPNSDPEDLYRALRLLSEGYANYYQDNYEI